MEITPIVGGEQPDGSGRHSPNDLRGAAMDVLRTLALGVVGAVLAVSPVVSLAAEVAPEAPRASAPLVVESGGESPRASQADPAPLDSDVAPTQAPATPPRPPQPALPATTPPAARPAARPAPGANGLALGTNAGANALAGAGAGAGAVADANLTGLGFNERSFMIGDQAPFSMRQFFPQALPSTPNRPFPPRPPVPPTPGQAGNRPSVILPWVRGFKIADNQSPRPQDRVFYTFNYFDNLNGATNHRLNSPFSDLKVYRSLFGLEKTLLDGNASVGFRLPLNTLTASSPFRNLGGTNTDPGNLTFFSKYVLWQDPKTGSLVSTGLAVTVPSGPRNFAGAPLAGGFRDVQFQKYVGYIWNRGRFYAHGFEAIDVPTDSRDVTMLYNDFGVGYYLYQSADPGAFLSAIAPTFETHVNVPLNHRGALRFNDPAGTADVVDLTFGINAFLGKRSVLTFAYVSPVTGPRPFNSEWSILYNYNFGNPRGRRPTPPVVGN